MATEAPPREVQAFLVDHHRRLDHLPARAAIEVLRAELRCPRNPLGLVLLNLVQRDRCSRDLLGPHAPSIRAIRFPSRNQNQWDPHFPAHLRGLAGPSTRELPQPAHAPSSRPQFPLARVRSKINPRELQVDPTKVGRVTERSNQWLPWDRWVDRSNQIAGHSTPAYPYPMAIVRAPMIRVPFFRIAQHPEHSIPEMVIQATATRASSFQEAQTEIARCRTSLVPASDHLVGPRLTSVIQEPIVHCVPSIRGLTLALVPRGGGTLGASPPSHRHAKLSWPHAPSYQSSSSQLSCL